MKTFDEFLLMCEDYYGPNEKLPSGKTPLGKAKARGITGEKLAKVKRGADNRNLDRSSHPDLEVTKHPTDRNHVTIHHKPSGVKFTLSHKGKTKQGKDMFSTVWTHTKDESKGPMGDREARQVVRDANKVHAQHIAHRYPHDSIAHNNPLPSYKEKGDDYVTTNPRARIYKRWGYGEPQGNPDMPDQYAHVKRPPSPKQKAKGQTRLRPINDPDKA